MKFDYYQYEISAHFVSAIINMDYTGLNDLEEAELNRWLDDLPVKNGHFDIVDYDGETFFSRCEIIGLYSECLNLRVYFPLNEATK